MGELIEFKPTTYTPSLVEVVFRRLGIKRTPSELPDKVTPIQKPITNVIRLRR